MISDSNDELTSTPSSRKRKSASPKSNLEFDFGGGARRTVSKIQSEAGSAMNTAQSESQSTTSDSSAIHRIRTEPIAYPSQSKLNSSYSKPSSVSLSPSMSNPSPAFSQFQQNVARQSREQKAVGSLLSGVAIAIIMAVLLVAGLAGYGGYILSQQIKQQSATVAQLDAKTSANYDLLSRGLKETATAVDGLNSQILAQKQVIQSLQTQLEAVRNTESRDRSNLDARFKKLDVRLLEVEREVLKR